MRRAKLAQMGTLAMLVLLAGARLHRVEGYEAGGRMLKRCESVADPCGVVSAGLHPMHVSPPRAYPT